MRADFRSDTLTRPTEEMRRAMAEAEVGDDVFGEDPTVQRLERRAAELFAQEAGLFVPSGTMANLLAVMCQAPPATEVVVEARSHVMNSELAGAGRLAGVLLRPVESRAGTLDAARVRAALRRPAKFWAHSSLICLENTHNFWGGRVVSVEDVAALRAVADEYGLPLHLDGARIFNACAAAGVEPAAYGKLVDSLSVCLSKGLSAPVGSLLLGSAALIERARRQRKMLGGGMRQVGILAAAGLVALDTMPARLGDDHAAARTLAEGLAAHGLAVDLAAVETNIVFAATGTAARDQALVAALAARDVHAIALGALGIRFVTHREACGPEVAHALEVLAEVWPTLGG